MARRALGPGEERLRRALGRQRGRPPLSLAPTTPFEVALLERLNALQADVVALQDQNRWLLRLIGGLIVAALVEWVLR